MMGVWGEFVYTQHVTCAAFVSLNAVEFKEFTKIMMVIDWVEFNVP